ncbi:hypothetical protein [Paenibacillus sp. IHBB 3054]|uniref:hypothetical protein n=1 Tax=Paenibacillus sp. IHBB 3054 TaxID=3425689 RepID=UPI003F66DAF6
MFKLKKVMVTVVAALILALPTSVFANEGIQDENVATQVNSKTLVLNTETHQVTALNPEDVEGFLESTNSQTPAAQASAVSPSGLLPEGNFSNTTQVIGTLEVAVFGTTEGRAYANLTMKTTGFYGIKKWAIDVAWSNGENDPVTGTNNAPLQVSYAQSQTVYSNVGGHSVNIWGYITLANGDEGYLNDPIIVPFTTS